MGFTQSDDMPEVTIDTIMDWFNDKVEKHEPIGPNMWLDGARKVNALMGNLDEDLISAEMELNRNIANALSDEKLSSARARDLAKATPDYARLLKLKAKKEQAIEFIRLAKKDVVSPQWDA